MLYYRFRPLTELSLKELLYNEIYFSSPEECNDPFDSKTFYSFTKDIEKWVNLIFLALSKYYPKPNITGEQLKSLSEHFCSKCPLSFDDIITKNLLDDFKINSEEDVKLVKILTSTIPEIAKVCKPATRYFVSFSKDANEPLMWSHYASKHNGFCLIFRPINNNIKQFEFRKKRQIRRKTPRAFAEEMSFGIPDEFTMSGIDYLEHVKPSDAFLHMPVAVSGDAKDEEHRENIRKEQESQYSQKGKNWNYETEARLILSPPPSWLFGEHIAYTQQERLFHYDPCHLVGIIYGSRMTEIDKTRVSEIINESREWNIYYPNYKRIQFNFVEFTASQSSSQRQIIIKPKSLSVYSNHKILPDDKDFTRLYKEWQDGWGIEFDGSKGTKIRVV